MLEEPVTTAQATDKFGTNCHKCLAPIKNSIPCIWCSMVVFCSIQCRNFALLHFHRFECSIMKLLVDSGLNVHPMMALRLVTNFGLAEIRRLFRDGELSQPNPKWASCYYEGNKLIPYESLDFVNAFHHFGPSNPSSTSPCISACYPDRKKNNEKKSAEQKDQVRSRSGSGEDGTLVLGRRKVQKSPSPMKDIY